MTEPACIRGRCLTPSTCRFDGRCGGVNRTPIGKECPQCGWTCSLKTRRKTCAVCRTDLVPKLRPQAVQELKILAELERRRLG